MFTVTKTQTLMINIVIYLFRYVPKVNRKQAATELISLFEDFGLKAKHIKEAQGLNADFDKALEEAYQ